jgi:hypothetical protein
MNATPSHANENIRRIRAAATSVKEAMRRYNSDQYRKPERLTQEQVLRNMKEGRIIRNDR